MFLVTIIIVNKKPFRNKINILILKKKNVIMTILIVMNIIFLVM